MKTKEKTYRIIYKYNGEERQSGIIRERDYSEVLLDSYIKEYGEAEYVETGEEY